jgi:hypothetical protein
LKEKEEFAGWIAIFNGKKLEIKKSEAKDLWGAKQLAIKKLKVPKSKQGLLAIDVAYDEMKKEDKYLSESKESDALKSMNNIKANTLRTAYYGVGDHIEKLAIMLNELCGDTGLFCKDLKLAVQARDAFKKITLGKYI